MHHMQYIRVVGVTLGRQCTWYGGWSLACQIEKTKFNNISRGRNDCNRLRSPCIIMVEVFY